MKLVVVGKKCEFDSQIDQYLKRLKPPFGLEIIKLAHSSSQSDQARKTESQAIRGQLKPTDRVILLDERGQQLNNHQLVDQLMLSKPTVLVIGGAYGVDEQLRARADFTLSLSQLVLPHDLVRLLVVEQVYRSWAIFTNHPYHHV
jgi:23S rRNA (pseudouridine1915-N3)-methyltransferase